MAGRGYPIRCTDKLKVSGDPSTPPTSRRNLIKVHPEAEIFRMMSVLVLRETGADIGVHGQSHPVVMYRNEARELWLLDGRNRLDARVDRDYLATLGVNLDDLQPIGAGCWAG